MYCEIVRGEASAFRWPSALANCPSGKRMTGGGGKCIALGAPGVGDVRLTANAPENDNTWRVNCDTGAYQNVRAEAFAVCI